MGGGGGFPGMGAFSQLPGALRGLNSRNNATNQLGGRAVRTRMPQAVTGQVAQWPSPSLKKAPRMCGVRRGPNAFDCSGLVQWSYGQAGVSLPRTTYDLVHAGVEVSRNNIRAGDLILCNFQGGRPEHVVMAVSPTMTIEAPDRGQRVQFSLIPTGISRSVASPERGRLTY